MASHVPASHAVAAALRDAEELLEGELRRGTPRARALLARLLAASIHPGGAWCPDPEARADEATAFRAAIAYLTPRP
jgi:hypothetical protein